MSEIPEDIWQAADVAASEYWFGDHLSGRAKSIIARAILAERERCAGIAEDHASTHDSRVADWIASAIRNQKT